MEPKVGSKRAWKILPFIISIIAIIFGDNLYEQITGHSIFRAQQEIPTPIVIVVTVSSSQTLPDPQESTQTYTTTFVVPATIQIDTTPQFTSPPPQSNNDNNFSEPDASPTSLQLSEFAITRSFCGNKMGSFFASPNQYIIGDIVIDNISYTDMQDATEEGTIAYFEREAQVTANWGAGCWEGDISNLQDLIREEFEIGCGGPGCETLRVVIVTASNGPIVTCYGSIGEIVSCPVTYSP